MEELTYDQKLAKVMLKLRSIRPFYSAIYESLEKRETSSQDTIGVTTNTLVYNPKFIDETEFSELLFINLHEIAHVALMHVARRENRDPELWNIACDLYVNRSLTTEFYITPGKSFSIDGYTEIKAPQNGLYCDTIDLEKDYVENIYQNLENQAKKNGYFSKQDGKYHFEYTGSGKNELYGSYRNRKESPNNKFEIDIEIKGDCYSRFNKDLIDDGSDQNKKEQESRKIISDAKVRSEMQGYKAGDTTSNIERLVNELLKSHLNWKKLFKKYLVQISSADSSFQRPDKRMYYQKAIYPGQLAEESNHINGVKICIDTSGSISDEDMSRFYYQVYEILRQFKVNAELIYWDAEVKSIGQVKNFKEFTRIDCFGGGGTQPQVVFERFKEKKEKPSVILMLTDGYFYDSWEQESYRKLFKDTIWVMTEGYNKEFKPSFGKLAIAEFAN